MDSILNSVKKILGIDPSYTAFDPEIVIMINSVFATLSELGIGPASGYEIEDENSIWIEFLDNKVRLNAVKTYIYLRVRIMFDPPTSSFALEALKEQVREHEWRLSINPEGEQWTDPQTQSSSTTILPL